MHRLELRANLVGLGHFYPDMFHLANSSAWEIFISLKIRDYYSDVFSRKSKKQLI